MPARAAKKPIQWNNISELNKCVDVQVKINSSLQCKQYCKSANDIYKKAEALYDSGDDENAYILFMRYFHIVKNIKKTYEYTKAKNLYDPVLKQCDIRGAVSKAEELQTSLDERYAKKLVELQTKQKIEKQIAIDKQNNTIKQTPDSGPKTGASLDDVELILPDVPDTFSSNKTQENTNNTNKDTTNNTVDTDTKKTTDIPKNVTPTTQKPVAGYISVADFYDLKKQYKDNLNEILLIDIRPREEFNAAQITHPCSINIPDILLQVGANINSIERKLNKLTWDVWSTRFNKKYLIIIDYEFDDETCSPTCSAYILQDILCKFDGTYQVLILTGGFKLWHLHYPSITTNPQYSKKPQFATIIDPSTLLQNLTYPKLPSKKSMDVPPQAEEVNKPHITPATDTKENIDPSNNMKPGTNQVNSDLPNSNKTDKTKVPDKLSQLRKMLSESETDESTDTKNNDVVSNGNLDVITKNRKQSTKTFIKDKNNIVDDDIPKLDTRVNPEDKTITGQKKTELSVLPNSNKNLQNEPNSTPSVDMTKPSNTSVNDVNATVTKQPSNTTIGQSPQSNSVISSKTSQSINKPTTNQQLPQTMQPHQPQPPIQPTQQPKHSAQPPQQTIKSNQPLHPKQLPQDQQPMNNQQTIKPEKLPTQPPHVNVLPQHQQQPKNLKQSIQQPQQPTNQHQSKQQLQPIIPQQPISSQQSTIPQQSTTTLSQQQIQQPQNQKTPVQPIQPKNIPATSNIERNNKPANTISPRDNQPTKISPRDNQNHIQPNNNLSNTIQPGAKSQTIKPSIQPTPQPTQQPKTMSKPKKDPTYITTYGLPQGWEKAINHENGRMYYKDHNTQTTHWELPAEIQKTLLKNEVKPAEDTEEIPIVEKKKSVRFAEEGRPSLKRSFSSPNIAEIEGDSKITEGESKTKVPATNRPVIDRSIKPKEEKKMFADRSTKPISRGRLQHLSPMNVGKGPNLTGLKNLGNTCYMNSVLQCLSNTTPLAKYFYSSRYEQDLNKRNMNPRPTEMARELAFLLGVLTIGQYGSISPIDFKLALGHFSTQFSGYEQQDSHELLMYLLDGLHEDVNRVKTRQQIKERDTSNQTDTLAADLAWKDYLKNNDSVVVDFFQGQFRSTVICLYCNKSSKTFDAFNCLQLELPANRSATLEECIRLFTKPERITGWKCPHCKTYRTAEKTIEIWKMPGILIVQLKRFRFDGRWRNKIQTGINFPVNNFNTSNYLATGSASTFKHFQLYGVINHYGTFESGHYTSYCRNARTSRWYSYDDNIVKDMDTTQVKTNAAYLLFYTAKDFKP